MKNCPQNRHPFLKADLLSLKVERKSSHAELVLEKVDSEFTTESQYQVGEKTRALGQP
jgi:hypothetical protein